MIHLIHNLFKKLGYVLLVPGLLVCLHGCIVAVPLAVIGGAQLYNAAKDQYPDINFEAEAPVRVAYHESQDRVWEALVNTLQDLQEKVEFVDKSSGIIRTVPKNFNDINWVDKSLGKSAFLYAYNIVCFDSTVKVVVQFTEEKFFDTKEKNIPEGSNMMRHILFKHLNKKVTKIAEEFPPAQPEQDRQKSPAK
jgi:hypothetical protein